VTIVKAPALSKVYQLLEPGPVVLLTTTRTGRANIMTMSWHMMVEFVPPLVACVVRNTGQSFAALRATRECVIALPAVHLAPGSGGMDNSPPRADETAGRAVAAPLVSECFANLECRVADTRLVNKYNLFVLEF
jgi:flavin reductase (DIM6/NTAB) family NADH-FMN oxidoreductase RutF